jgi:hypothetical protein
VSQLVRMRLIAVVRTQVALAPLLATLVLLGTFYGGGQAEPVEAYGVSAVLLFPVLAWQAKILLDVEPDVQRQIAATAVGSRAREVAAGLVAGALSALPIVLIGLVMPWIVGGVTMEKSTRGLGGVFLVGGWVFLLALLPAVALGALASRAISRTAGNGLVILVAGAVLTIVMGLKGSPVMWLAPPIMPMVRSAIGDQVDFLLLTAWALAWTAVATFGYFQLRRNRP